MFGYFFSYYDRLPDGAGFSLFGPEHLAALAVIAAACVLICLRFRRLNLDRQRFGTRAARWTRAVGWTVLALDLLRYLFLFIIGAVNYDLLPLHLCGLAVYITFYDAVRPGPLKREFLYSLCMPGALTALIFPAWNACPILSLLSLQCFVIHGLIVLYPIMLIAGGVFRPDFRRLPRCFLMLVLIGIPIFFFNKLVGTNFMFINMPLQGTPLELFARWFGVPGYILGMAGLIWLIWLPLYLPFVRASRHADRS